MLLRDPPEPPDPSTLEIENVLLASEGRDIPRPAVDFTAEIARRSEASVHVFSIARVWGTGLGLPMPGLLPSKREWDDQHAVVERAVTALRKRGLQADGRVVGTRKGAKRITREAERLGCDAIVMGADPRKPWLVGDFMWSQEPHRVRRRARVPVYLIQPGPGAA
ncbi:MAG TPA: universal stress protein [Gaiellaceae bacterium]|jgi:nucleotide-binding universal stress UspA family protein